MSETSHPHDYVDRAKNLLTLAEIYLEDGAPATAIERAQEAIAFMRREQERRNRIISGLSEVVEATPAATGLRRKRRV